MKNKVLPKMTSLVKVFFRNSFSELRIIQPLLDAVHHHIPLLFAIHPDTNALKIKSFKL